MKKSLIYIVSIIFFLVLCSQVNAMVTGACSDCHTMHNSQAGGPMAQELTSGPWGWADDTTPNPSLLMYSCVGCHTNLTNTTITEDNAPIVFNPSGPTNPLAGGNFYYILDVVNGDARGHNVLDIKGQDATLGLTPPGGALMSSQLRCAGTYGCHGSRTESDQLDAMKTAHHTDDAAPLTGGTSVGKSYRFLKGILGKEDTDWEQDNTNTSHNEYKGAANFTTTSSISYLCGNCHSNFHSAGGVNSASPWLRHPTDYTLPGGTTEYAGYTTYNMMAPVARPNLSDLPSPSDIVRPGTDIIMCLSCHRAHGSPYYKMIRWDYKSATLLTALEGCVVCHTSKK